MENIQKCYKALLLVCIITLVNFLTEAIALEKQFLKSTSTYDVKKGVVSVSNDVKKAAYGFRGQLFGSGFLVDKKRGLILTNVHVARPQSTHDIRVLFFNGRELNAKLFYHDPWQDFAFLKVNTEEIPEEAVELKLAQYDPKLEQNVSMIGNNQGQNFSIQSGLITSIYRTSADIPYQYLTVSLNTRGGASGSPVIDHKGQVLGIVFASDETFANAIPVQYLRDALTKLQKGITPKRQDTGALLSYYSLDHAAKFSKLPRDIIDNYIANYPESRNFALAVDSVIEDAPANGILQPRDIIWAINGITIGPDLYKLQKLMNDAKENIVLSVYRDGILQELKVGLYDLDTCTIKRMLLFGGAVFFEADDQIRMITGAPKDAVCVVNIEQGASFDVFPYGFFEHFGALPFIHIIRVANTNINTLDDLIAIIPTLVHEKEFTVSYRNLGFYQGFGYIPILSRVPRSADVNYRSYGDYPILLQYDKENLFWAAKSVLSRE